MEEVADATLSLILNLYRRTHWLATNVSHKLVASKQQFLQHSMASQQPVGSYQAAAIAASTPEQTRELANGVVRIRGECLGLVGFGKVFHYICAITLFYFVIGEKNLKMIPYFQTFYPKPNATQIRNLKMIEIIGYKG